MNRVPSFGPIREVTLSAINGVFTRIRERLEAVEAKVQQSPASEAALAAIEKQVKALQMGAKTTTVVQQQPTTPAPPVAAAATIPEVAADPATPGPGEAWVLRTLLNPAGTLQGFAGGFPLVTAIVTNRFDLSIATTEGTKRVQIA